MMDADARNHSAEPEPVRRRRKALDFLNIAFRNVDLPLLDGFDLLDIGGAIEAVEEAALRTASSEPAQHPTPAATDDKLREVEEAPTENVPPVRGEEWIERWCGSGMWKGSSIWTTDNIGCHKNMVEHFGGDEKTHASVRRIVAAHNAALALIPELRAGMGEAENRGAGKAIARLVNTSRAIGFQAGVGGRETAGAIVSYLATSPDEIEPFVAGTLTPLDFKGDWMRGGCLTWHAANGKVVSPNDLAALSTAPRQGEDERDGPSGRKSELRPGFYEDDMP